MQVGTLAAVQLNTGSVKLQQGVETDTEEYRAIAHLAGPEDARPQSDAAFFDNKPYYGYLYQATDTGTEFYIDDATDAWETLPSGDGLWADTDSDGLAELPDHDGVSIGKAEVGFATLDSFIEEEGTTTVTGSGTLQINYDNVYRFASVAVGSEEGSSDWFGWIRNGDGNITGKEVVYDTGSLTSVTINWHVTGNQTENDYNA